MTNARSMSTQPRKTAKELREDTLNKLRGYVKKELDKLYTRRECLLQSNTDCINTYFEKWMVWNDGETPRIFVIQFNIHADDYLIFESQVSFT